LKRELARGVKVVCRGLIDKNLHYFCTTFFLKGGLLILEEVLNNRIYCIKDLKARKEYERLGEINEGDTEK